MNCMPRVLLPEPEGPARSMLSPSGMPPPSIASSLAMPVERRRVPLTWPSFSSLSPKVRGKVCRPSSVMRKVCMPGTELLAANLHDLHLADDRVALDALVEPEQAVGDGEHRVVAQLALGVFADQERSGLPTGEVQGQALNEALELQLGGARTGPARGGPRCGRNRRRRSWRRRFPLP